MKENYKDLPHILVVDDDQRISSLVCRYLNDHNMLALRAESAKEARIYLGKMEFDAIVLDVMMPEESGFDFATRLQTNSINIPILFLTALGELDDRVTGFESGADDYLTKPFEPQELVLRLNAILRRTRKKIADEQLFIGKWSLNGDYIVDGQEEVRLTTMELNLLRALAKHSGEVISREALAKACELDAGERTIDVQITRLRRKIEEDSKNPKLIQTVRGKGYLLRVGRG
mgnify:CR=1 FL=1